jgi:hypothetical protein
MRRAVWLGACLMALLAAGPGGSREPGCCEPVPDAWLQRWHPAGGWHPYGGGLLRWWPAHCFPRGGAPDDYCRKPLPRVCWPPYPSFYTWGLPAAPMAPGAGCRPCPP